VVVAVIPARTSLIRPSIMGLITVLTIPAFSLRKGITTSLRRLVTNVLAKELNSSSYNRPLTSN
jgi:hypothetical protein